MYQLGTKWKLWELQHAFNNDANPITLRGYSKEPPVSFPADFHSFEKRLSVEKIASKYCPTRRDIYFQIKQGIRQKSKNRTWGQAAGNLIEEYCKGILDYFSTLSRHPEGLNYKKIHKLAEEYTKSFWNQNEKKFNELRQKAINSEENPDRLVFLLQQTAKYELSLLGADFAFSKVRGRKFVPLLDSIPIIFDSDEIAIAPHPSLGLGDITTPDFIIMSPDPVIGDVKSGISLKPFHLTTIAGYALAYESQHNVNVDYGVIYFFETHSKQMNFAQSYVFLIDDFLRKQFLLTRDQLYSLLQSEKVPPVADAKDYETFCSFCKFHAKCYPDKPR